MISWITLNVSIIDRSYEWTIPEGQTTSDYYRNRIRSASDSSISDYSDDYFRIYQYLPK